MNRKTSWKIWGKRLAKLVLIVLPLVLLWWVFRQVPFEQIWKALQQLSLLQVIIWLLVNVVLIKMISALRLNVSTSVRESSHKPGSATS